MITTTVDVQGLDELDEKLRELGTVTGAKGLRSALLTTTAPMFKDTKAGVPVDQGELRKSIGRRTRIEKKGRTRDVAMVRVGAIRKASWRAHFIEFGTIKMPGRPFIRPAWERNKDQLLARFAVELRNKIERASQKK